jgi:hypothetical protein
MDLKLTAREYDEKVDKLAEHFKKKITEAVLEDEIDTDSLDFFKDLFATLEMSTRLIVGQAQMIQQINDKLDCMAKQKKD